MSGFHKTMMEKISKTKEKHNAHKLFDLRASTQSLGRRHVEVHFSLVGVKHPHHIVCAYAKCVHTTVTPSIHTPKINCRQKRHHSHKTITHILTRNTHKYIFNLTKPQKKGPHDVIKPLQMKNKNKDVQKPKLSCGMPIKVVDQLFFSRIFSMPFLSYFLNLS